MTSPKADRPEWALVLHQARTDLGWDPHRLAKEMKEAAGPDATANTESLVRRIRAWESGREGIRERYRLLLARVLEIEADELAGRTNSSAIAREDPTALLSPPGGATLELTFYPSTGVDASLMEDDAFHTIDQIHSVLARAAPERVVEQLETDVNRLCRQYVSTPVHRLYAQITHRRHHALKLLPTLSHPDQTRRVHIAAARLVGLHAHACLDLGAYDRASTFTDAAWALAANSADPGLCGWVSGLHSLIAYWDGRPRDAQQAAEEGLAQPVTDSNKARLHALRARAAAAQGDQALARTAVATAQEHAALPLLPGVLGFPDGKISAYAGTALLMLDSSHDRRLSIIHAERAITQYSTGNDRSVGDLLAARLDLATAHLHAGNFDGVLEQVQIVTATPAGHCTASIAQRAQRLLPLLENTDSALALASREHLIAFGRTPGATPARAEEG